MERLRRFSPSSLESYRSCPLKFKYAYLDHLRRKPSTVEAVLGTSVHRALEEVYLARMKGRVLPLEEAISVYELEWARAFQKEVRFIAGGNPADYHRLGRECLERYWNDHHPFDADKTVGVERHVAFELPVADPAGSDTAIVHGYIDRLSIGRDGVFEIHDYKTSKSLPPVADKEADWQLAIYDSAIRRLWPGLGEVRLVWHFLRHGQKIVVTRRPEQQPVLDREVHDLILKIWADQGAGRFVYREGPLCDWCDFKEECPRWKHVEAFAALPEDERKNEAGVKLVDEYAGLEARKKELKADIARIEEEQHGLAERLLDYGERHGVTRVAGSEHEADLVDREEVKFPTRTQAPQKVEEMEAELKATPAWPEVSRLDTRSLLEAVKDGLLSGEASAAAVAFVEKWGRKERQRAVRLHKRRAEE
ncbi:MAG: PD-(D/E)XK nuclease family protein [Elusimicrobia bacterium]|nr:PD-(D/E)XK nuclease family protein [Elusimicrobiota bacterium]